jgi:hypothetical protein
MTSWRDRIANKYEVDRLLDEARALEDAAEARYREASRVMYESVLPHSIEEVEEDCRWLDEVVSVAGDGAAIIDAEGSIIGKISPFNGVIKLG